MRQRPRPASPGLWAAWLLAAAALVIRAAAAAELGDAVVMHKKVRHSALRAVYRHLARRRLGSSTAPSHPRGARHEHRRTGMELLQKLAHEGSSPAVPTHARRKASHTAFLQRSAEGQAAAATPAEEGQAQSKEEQQLKLVGQAQEEADAALSNNEYERDMLQTQMLSSSQSMQIIKQMALSVKRMRAEVEALEKHEKLCRKRVADLKNGQYQRAEDEKLADTVQVVSG
mmetsp:Transcript_36300/g.72254  ORF Transcript_36300/g.72254 Transcript_36300/m.72254 type:complete len:229 (-) Transcript_36300:78-764(-)